MNKNYHLMRPGNSFPSLSLHIGVDLETTGLSLADPEVWICGIGIGDQNGQYYFPLRHTPKNTPPFHHKEEIVENYQGEERTQLLSWLRSLFSNPSRTVLFHNAPFDLGFLRKEFGATHWDFFRCGIEDSMLLATLLNENRSVSLEQLTRNVLQIRPEQKEKFQGFYKFATLPPQEVSDYCCEDVWLTLNLFTQLTRHPEYESLKTVYRQELQFSFTLAQLELQGCPFSSSQFTRIQNQLRPKWEHLLKEVYTRLPHTISEKEFLRAPSRITAEFLQISQSASLSTEPENENAELLALWHLLDRYEQLHKILELFPKTLAPTVSPRYLLTKAEGRPFSLLQQLSKNPLSEEWELKKLISACPSMKLYELNLEELFPRLALAQSQDPLYHVLLQNSQGSIFQILSQRLALSIQKTQEVVVMFFSGQPLLATPPEIESELQALFPHWVQFQIHLKTQVETQGYLSSFLGRRRRFTEKYAGHAVQTFLNLSRSELIKPILSALSDYVALQTEDKILLQLPHPELLQSVLHRIPNPFLLGNTLVPLKFHLASGKNWQELNNLHEK